MPQRGNQRRRLRRAQDRLAIAGNGCYLAGSLLYLVDAATPAALLFVVGSIAVLLASAPRLLIRLWIQPRESEADPVPPPVTTPIVAS